MTSAHPIPAHAPSALQRLITCATRRGPPSGLGSAAAREDLRDVLVSLLAEVAQNYVDVRSYQARLAIAEANREAQEGTYHLALDRLNAGAASGLAVEQAKYNLESTRSQIPTFLIALEQAKIRLAVLIGENPGAVDGDLAEREPIPITPGEVAVGVPADCVRRRPNVRRAERQLAAETARASAWPLRISTPSCR